MWLFKYLKVSNGYDGVFLRRVVLQSAYLNICISKYFLSQMFEILDANDGFFSVGEHCHLNIQVFVYLNICYSQIFEILNENDNSVQEGGAAI